MRRNYAKEKINAARKRMKKHLRSKGENSDFFLDEQFCLYWWHRLNISVFDGMLTPPVRFELRAFRDESLGWCKPYRWNSKKRRVIIGINTELFDRRVFLCVLAHEMVHQWQWEVLGRWEDRDASHGKTFFSWRNKLRTRVGLPLQVRY